MTEHGLQQSEVSHHFVAFVRVFVGIFQQVQRVKFEVVLSCADFSFLFAAKETFESRGFGLGRKVGEREEFGLLFGCVFIEGVDTDLFLPGVDQLVFHLVQEVDLLLGGDGFLELIVVANDGLVYILIRVIILFFKSEHGLIGAATHSRKTTREFIYDCFIGTGFLGQLQGDR